MILHIPHAKTKIKHIEDYTSLKNSMDILTDWYTDELFKYKNSKRLVFPYSRLYCDVERFKENEEMDKHKMGVFYTRTNYGMLRMPQKESLSDVYKIYDEWHNKLDKLSKHHKIIIDCHSFYPVKLQHETSYKRPDFCIGTNESTPKIVLDLVKTEFQKNNYSYKLNDPFSGTMTPKNANIHSIMIEVNKKLYLDKPYTYGHKSENFKKTQKFITNLLDKIYNLYK